MSLNQCPLLDCSEPWDNFHISRLILPLISGNVEHEKNPLILKLNLKNPDLRGKYLVRIYYVRA